MADPDRGPVQVLRGGCGRRPLQRVLLHLDPQTATSGTDGIGTTWQSAVTGNLAIIGTAPALPGTSAATTLITNSVAYAAAGWSSSSDTGTGLYLSLNCDYSTAAASTAVPLLDGVEGISSSNGLTVQGSLSCSDNGTVNGWGAANAKTFSGFTGAALAAGGSTWPSPSCPVEEAFDSWPGKTTTWTSGTFTPLAYDGASDATGNFTASDGATGQPYILLGSPSQPAASLSPSTGGQVPADAAAGGPGNAAVPGLSQPVAADVNTESGDFTQSATDVSVPGFGPSLAFSRSYDAQAAQRETQTGKPGPMGYGWTDNWASSLSTTSPTPGDIYTPPVCAPIPVTDAAPSDVAGAADAVVQNGSDVYIVDESDNHILEIPATTKTQWGRSMTAGKMYVVAGSTAGSLGDSSGGAPLGRRCCMTLSVAWRSTRPGICTSLIRITTGSRRSPASGTAVWGISMTAGDIYTDRRVRDRVRRNRRRRRDRRRRCWTRARSGWRRPAARMCISRMRATTGSRRWRRRQVTQWGLSRDRAAVHHRGVGDRRLRRSGEQAAMSALLGSPEGVALDSSGDLYVADKSNDMRSRRSPRPAGPSGASR